jgi:hypothetical protein
LLVAKEIEVGVLGSISGSVRRTGSINTKKRGRERKKEEEEEGEEGEEGCGFPPCHCVL